MRSMGSSIVFHNHWSRGQSMVVKVRNDNGFQDVPLISLPIKIAFNSDQIQLAIMRNVSSHYHRQMDSFLDVAGGIGGIWLSPHTSSSISHVQKKAAFFRPTDFSTMRL